MAEALEVVLRAVGERIEFPDSSDVAERVGARLGARPALRLVSTRRALRPVGGAPRWQRAIAIAAALAVVASGVLALSPRARRAVADFLGLRGERITVVPSLNPSPAPLGTALQLGQVTTVPGAQGKVPFTILAASEPDLGAPVVYLGFTFPDGQVSFVYPPGPELPAVGASGIGMLLTEFRGRVDQQFIQKFIDAGTEIEAVTVDGAPGYWISGGVHEIVYLDPDGVPISNTLRLAGNVLLWQRGDVTLRIESSLSLDQALAIARSVR
jgi:hypothetical protein